MSSVTVYAQDARAADQRPKNEFFSGTVTACDPDNVTVVKTVLGKNKESRTFLITKETRIEGTLRVKARVTVRYTRDDAGYRATHIIVRTTQRK